MRTSARLSFTFLTCLTLTRDQLCPLIIFSFWETCNCVLVCVHVCVCAHTHTDTHPNLVKFEFFLNPQMTATMVGIQLKRWTVPWDADSSVYSVPTVERWHLDILGTHYGLLKCSHTTTGSRFNSQWWPNKTVDTDAAKAITAVKASCGKR